MPRRSLIAFFVLAFLLAIPFWLAGSTTDVQLLPGLPVAALATFCPALAAMIMAAVQGGRAGVTGLLARCWDYSRITVKSWYLVILLLMPVVMALSFVVERLASIPVPVPQVNPLVALILCAVFFLAALGEELGWSGYATDPLQERLGALWAALILGAIWAVYHYIGLVQAHRSLEWIAWWSVYTIAGRVILVWIYNNTGRSVFGTALFHMTINVTWQLFPVQGSYFDPRVTGLIMALVAAAAALLWGGRYLRRFRLG